MSLFSRLEERMRARDSQDHSKEKETAPADDAKGGLFGSIQLKPATGEPDVPPPASASGLTVPSLEEARAELDRIRAQSAQSEQGSGLFRRDKSPDDESASQTPRAPAEAPATRDSVSFSAVSLPPRAAEDAPGEAPPQTETLQAASEQTTFAPAPAPVADVADENVPSAEKPFRVPSFAPFAEAEDAPSQPAPDAATPPAPVAERTVYAPVSSEQYHVVALTEPVSVAPQEVEANVETLRSAEVQPVTPATPPAPESVAEERSAPAAMPRPSNASNMTPFQRLMAARAAQGGPPIPRPRNERPANVPQAPRPNIEAPVDEVHEPVAETPQLESPREDAPVAEMSQAPSVDLPDFSAPKASREDEDNAPEASREDNAPEASREDNAPEASREDDAPEADSELSQPVAPQIEAPEVTPPAAQVPLPEPSAPVAAVAELSVPIELPQSPVMQAEEDAAMRGESAPISLDFASEASNGEASVVEASAPMPELEAPRSFTETAPPQDENSQTSEMEIMASRMESLVAQAREENRDAPEVDDEEPQDQVEAPDKEAEIVPEEVSTSTASSDDAESPHEMPNSEPPVRPALSLSERLARTPRAELDAAHAGAEALTPKILEDAMPAREIAEPTSAPTRSAASLSFAERLAARTKPPIEPPAPATPPVMAPVEPSFTEPAAQTADETADEPSFTEPAAQTADETADEPAAQTADEPSFTEPAAQTADEPVREPIPEPAPRSGPRSFSERLAARTSLDRHLQVPAPESSPVSQDLATHNTELARINEGAELSEREMKNRVLFRQKHLIFDFVMGSIDQRTMQNPTRDSVKPQIEKGVDSALREFGLDLEQSERNWLVDEFVREVTDLGALVPMLEDPSVSKIVVTGANDVSVERLGRIERTGVSFRDDDHLLSLVRRIAELSGGRVDAKVPLLDRPLPDGGRIRAKVPPLAPQPTLTIEKSTGNPFVVLKRQMAEKSRGDSLPYAQLRERIQQRLLREFEGDAAALAGDQDKLRLQVEEMIGSVIAEEHVVVTRAERASLVMDLLNEIVGLGPIEPLLNDPDVDEVMVNGPYQIYVERKGKLELTSQRFRDNGHVMQVIDRIVAPLGRRVDEKSPMVDGRLRDGSRFNAIIPPLALSGPTMTIRKFARDPFTMSDLINFGTITREAAQFLQAAVEGRLNIVVSGGTGSGKTTTLNVLSSFIPSTERIVTIEDAAELQMRQEHVIRMETRPPNIEGVGEVSIRDLVKNSLRMRPDRIVVGECRGGEALDMLQAMNTGHDGSLTTAHSNGPRDTCKRLETMVMMAGFDLPVRAIREQISMAVQLVVHQERMRDGKRRVTAITEIVGMEGDVLTMQDIFRFEQEGMDDDGRIIGSLQATGMRPKYYETIVDNGGTISMDIFAPKPHEAAPRARLNERGGR